MKWNQQLVVETMAILNIQNFSFKKYATSSRILSLSNTYTIKCIIITFLPAFKL